MKYLLRALPLLLLASPAFAAVSISLDAFIDLIIYVVVLGLIFWILLLIVGATLRAEPWLSVATTLIYIVGGLTLIALLLNFIGHPVVVFRQ